MTAMAGGIASNSARERPESAHLAEAGHPGEGPLTEPLQTLPASMEPAAYAPTRTSLVGLSNGEVA